MIEASREGLFVAYSRADAKWRDMFLRDLMSRVPESAIFVDRTSIPGGADWQKTLTSAMQRARCALLLLTDHYLKIGSPARDKELPALLAAQQQGLQVLPVLVEPCAWKTIPKLRELQLMPWPGDMRTEAGREVKRALSEADSAGDAVVNICAAVAETLDDNPTERTVTRGFTDNERADIPRQMKSVFANRAFSLTSEQPVHTGEFALVYSGLLDGERVAVKVIPTPALRKRVQRTLKIAEEARKKLRDTSFVHVEQITENSEIQAVVMEYVEWPTLHNTLRDRQGRLSPPEVARLLSSVSRAQSDAHKRGVPLGALSPRSIFVDSDGEVRLSPFRIEAHLARGLTLGVDQVVSRDVLEMLTPEIYDGRPPVDKQEMDAHGQYYLGLLGLELLLGRRPVQIACFKDLTAKAAFFHDPRRHFELGESRRWTDEAPALAFVLARLLARQPGDRLKSAEVVSQELHQVAEDELPDALRRCLESDYEQMIRSNGGFMTRFYERLFALRPALASMFGRSAADQSVHLALAMRDLVDFHRRERLSRFRDHAQAHARMGITQEDADAFRRAFVAEVVATFEPSEPNITAQMHGDAWNAALKLGIAELLDRSDPNPRVAAE